MLVGRMTWCDIAQENIKLKIIIKLWLLFYLVLVCYISDIISLKKYN